MTYILPSIYFVLVVAHAWYHDYLIEEKNRRIYGNQKLFEWSFISLICLCVFGSWVDILPLIILPIVTRLAFFDIVLNFWRGNNWLYEGEISKKKSFWDYIENRIGLPVYVYRIIYLLMYIIYILTFYNVI
jgi:hypothetical protein